MKPGDREYFNRLLEELLEFEEKHEIFWLTREERREFQAYVKWLTEFAKLPPHGDLIDRDQMLAYAREDGIFDLSDLPEFASYLPVVIAKEEEGK